MYRYRLYALDGGELGEAHYAVLIKPGEEITTGDGRKYDVVDVLPVDEDEGFRYVGLLRVVPRD